MINLGRKESIIRHAVKLSIMIRLKGGSTPRKMKNLNSMKVSILITVVDLKLFIVDYKNGATATNVKASSHNFRANR